MSSYKVIDEFQANDVRGIVLDRPMGDDTLGKLACIDGKKYRFTRNSARQLMGLPGVHESFAGKTVEFV